MDKNLSGGIFSLLLALVFFYLSRRERYSLRLAERLPVTPAALVQEGMVEVAGKAVSSLLERSSLLGLNCIASRTTIELHVRQQNKSKWVKLRESKRAVPFYVEDASGRIYVDPEQAEFELGPELELRSDRKWRPSSSQRALLESLRWTGEGLHARLRDRLYEIQLTDAGLYDAPAWMRRAAVAGYKKIEKAMNDPQLLAAMQAEGLTPERFAGLGGQEREKLAAQMKRTYDVADRIKGAKVRATEACLLAGDAVYVIGPAFHSPEEDSHAQPIAIRKVHPGDTLLIGDGTPEEVHARIVSKSRKTALIGLAFVAAGLLLLYEWYRKNPQ